MDILKTTEPKSDQQNYDDYTTAPKTVTITEVKSVGGDQPIELHLKEAPGRPYKPAKSMRRVIIAAWGSEASAYIGRQLTLYGDPSIRFGKDAVGGIRISHMSNITEPLTVSLTITRGKRAPFVVQPLDDHLGKHVAALTGATTLNELQTAWAAVTADGVSGVAALVVLKDARKTELAQTGVLDAADPLYVES